MKKIRLTMAQALVRHLAAQRIRTASGSDPLFHGVFAIFGHGNVAGIGEALAGSEESLPTFRAHNEQAMAHAAIAFAKANQRRRMMACTTSVGPGATNLVTAAALGAREPAAGAAVAGRHLCEPPARSRIAAARRLWRPDCHGQRLPETGLAVLDRITRPEKLLASLPQAILGAARSGRLRAGDARVAPGRAGGSIRLPQRVLRESACTTSSGRDRIARRWRRALRRIRSSRRPLIVAGGGVHYSGAATASPISPQATAFPSPRPRPARYPCHGIIPVTPAASASPARVLRTGSLARIGPRARARHTPAGLHDRLGQARPPFRQARLIAINVAAPSRDQARPSPLRGDLLATLEELALRARRACAADRAWCERTRRRSVAEVATRQLMLRRAPRAGLPTDAQVLGAVNRALLAMATPSSAPQAACPGSFTSSGAAPKRAVITSSTATPAWAMKLQAASA